MSPSLLLKSRRTQKSFRKLTSIKKFQLPLCHGFDVVFPNHNKAIYRQRNLIERFFDKLKHFRRIATRFDKLAGNFLAAVSLASTRLWMRIYESTT